MEDAAIGLNFRHSGVHDEMRPLCSRKESLALLLSQDNIYRKCETSLFERTE